MTTRNNAWRPGTPGIMATLALAATVTLAGCERDMPDTSNARSVSGQGEVEPLRSEQSGVARRAAELLAGELNLSVTEVSVDSVRAVEWSDSSAGCPQPGEQYLQVITPGHRITLRAGGAMHFVHEANGRMFRCQRSKAVSGTTAQLELVWGQQAMVARRDLAGRLGVEESQVIIAGAEKTTFSDASLGCPEPGEDYAQGDRDGYVLRLRQGSRNYSYHTDLDRVIACPAISED